MLTRELYDWLPEEGKRECQETYEILKRSGDCAPDEWQRIVRHYYDVYNTPQSGWFRWWDEA